MNKRVLIHAVACAALTLCASAAFADDAVKPDQPAEVKVAPDKAADHAESPKPANPTTQPSDKVADTQGAGPTTQPSAIALVTANGDARKVLEEVSEAYGNLKSLELAGVCSGHFDVAGQESSGKIAFTASYASPNKFRHEVKDDVLVGSDGDKAYIFGSGDKVYAQIDAPKGTVANKDLPSGIREVLSEQNPSLLVALSKDPVEGVKISVKLDDTKVGEVSCQTLRLTLNDKGVLTILIDPTSHLIRRTNLDLKATLEAQKMPNVKEAFYNVDYTTVTPDAAPKDDQFAWAPPAGSKNIKDLKEPGDDSPATELVGKDAPDFQLAMIDGKKVSKADLKGKVYILDFWATWCGPCRASLPHLDELYKSEKEAGLIVYAVNCKEDGDTVSAFIQKTGLTVPVLLDIEGKAAEAYKAQGIPETVVVGKDGKVAKVVVGFNPEETPKMLKAAVDEAMKK